VSRGRFVILSIIFDAVMVNLGIVAAFFIRFGGELPSFNFAPYVALSPLITVLYLGAGYIFGLYEPERTESTWELARAAFQAVTLGTVLTVAVAFFAGPRFFSFSRLVIVIAWAAQFVLLVGWRAIILRFTAVRWPEQRILVVGTKEKATDLAGLKGKSIGAQIGTTSYFVIKDVKGFKAIKTYDEVGLAMEDLVKGSIQAVVADSPVAVDYTTKKYADKIKIASVLKSDKVENIGIAVKKGNKDVLDLVNKGLAAIKADGTFDKIKEQHQMK